MHMPSKEWFPICTWDTRRIGIHKCWSQISRLLNWDSRSIFQGKVYHKDCLHLGWLIFDRFLRKESFVYLWSKPWWRLNNRNSNQIWSLEWLNKFIFQLFLTLISSSLVTKVIIFKFFKIRIKFSILMILIFN